MSNFDIYHNPRCSKSRATLALLHEQGIEPNVIEYLKHVPSKAQIKRLCELLGVKPFELIRQSEAEFKALGLTSEMSDAKLIEAMHKNPKLIQRPIVVCGEKAAIGRPPENVCALID